MVKRLLFALAVFGVAACSPLTQDNYNKLESGMSKADVVALIGAPEQCENTLGFESCRWGDDGSNIEVRFAADNLVAKTAEGL